ncbi:hypothetical protein ACE1CI_36750 [Aerosakkonemataceae cyanobacterium BLCC-F50]|uniref:Uncharacterized protein n=1 Tax=Floridaenema flaviceps BLCC-F50 TaxID=3153642 RepID=A0ABV4Y3B4_9CYAN
MSNLIYPTLDLFLYDLKEALNSTGEAITKNQEIFTKKLPSDVNLDDPDKEVEYLELLPQDRFKHFKTDKLQGYYYPVRLNDTYGLQIDCSINNQTDPQSVNYFSNLKAEIESRLNQQPITLGQAWILSGWLPENSPQNPEAIAKDCYKTFSKDADWQRDFQGKGKFFGGNIFYILFGKTPVLILIYPQQNAQKVADIYPDWMGLFCYYSKINWSYDQSRFIKKSILDYYQKLEGDRQKITKYEPPKVGYQLNDYKQSLERLQQEIKQYSVDLLGMSFQKQVIEINLSNYETRLEFIQKKLDANSQIDFFQKFTDLVTKKYIVQIDKDSENMQIGLRLLEDNINAVRGGIELAKAERDRNFQEFVAVVGAGVAGVSFAPADKNCVPIFGQASLFCKTPVLFSLLVFVIAAGLTWLIRRKWK